MSKPKTFPIQDHGRVPWEVAEQAYIGYVKECGTSQTLERLGERGGFGVEEMDDFYPEWRSTTRLIEKLREQAKAWRVAHYYLKRLVDTCRFESGEMTDGLEMEADEAFEDAQRLDREVNGDS